MDYLQLHRELPLNLTTLVLAFDGWADAGRSATRAIRYLKRRLEAQPLANIDPEEFFDFTRVRPTIRTDSEGARTIDWPTNQFNLWHKPNNSTGLLMLQGAEPGLKWKIFAELILDLANRCGTEKIVSLAAIQAAIPHTRTPRVTCSSTDSSMHEMLKEWGILRKRRQSYQGPAGISTVLRELAIERGLPVTSFVTQVPHYIQTQSNPAAALALLRYVCPFLNIEIDFSRLERWAGEFDNRCNQAVNQSSEMQAYVQQLENMYDDTFEALESPVDEGPAINSEGILQDLEEFLRNEREGGNDSTI